MEARAEQSDEYCHLQPNATLVDLHALVHAQPGVTYCFVLLENQRKAREHEGWRAYVGAPLVRVGDADTLIMTRGEPVWGASPQAVTSMFCFDPDLPKRVGDGEWPLFDLVEDSETTQEDISSQVPNMTFKVDDPLPKPVDPQTPSPANATATGHQHRQAKGKRR